MGKPDDAPSINNKFEDCYVVSFDLDEKDQTCFLCVRVRDVWFYAEVWTREIKSNELRDRYIDLVNATLSQRRKAEQEIEGLVEDVKEERGADDADAVKTSLKPTDNPGPTSTAKQTDHQDERDENEIGETISPQNSNDDSGYASETKSQDEVSKAVEPPSSDAEAELRNILLSSLEPVFTKHAPRTVADEAPLSLAAWYNAPIHCFSLRSPSSSTTSTKLIPSPRPDLDGHAYLSRNIIPKMPLPKYLRSLPDIPFYNPSELHVLKTSHDIHAPMHPTHIRPKNQRNVETLFLKLASSDDASSVKRELRILSHLAKHDLYRAGIRAPRLAGLVGVPSTSPSSTTNKKSKPHSKGEKDSSPSRTQITGFLLTMVPEPARPLTHYMTPSIAARKRERWAKEAEDMVQVLHDHGIIWGDAKGDNFLVAGCEDEPVDVDEVEDVKDGDEGGVKSKHGKKEGKSKVHSAKDEVVDDDDDEDDGKGQVYIIDFGGGLTAGWVDEEVANTMAGDDMGTGRLVNGLVDPVNNVVGGQSSRSSSSSSSISSSGGQAKKENSDEEVEVGGKTEAKGDVSISTVTKGRKRSRAYTDGDGDSVEEDEEEEEDGKRRGGARRKLRSRS